MRLGQNLLQQGAAGGGLQPATVGYITNPSSYRFNSLSLVDPANMNLIQSYRRTSTIDGPNTTALDADSNLAFVGSVIDDVIVAFDVSDPTNMTPVGSISYFNPFCLAVDTNRKILFAAYGNALSAISYSQTGALTLIARITNADLYSPYYAALDKENNVLYLSSRAPHSFVSVDVSDPNNMAKVGEYINSSYVENAGLTSLDLEAQVAYVPAGRANTGYLTTIDISDPTNLTFLAARNLSTDYQGFCTAFDPANKIVYLTSLYGDSFISYDASNPSSLTQLDRYTSTSIDGPRDVRLDLLNNVAYLITTSSDMLVAIDISNPNSLSEIGAYGLYDNPSSFVINTGGPSSTNAYP